MKTLDLNAYGVSEMSQQELVETNGGIAPILIGIGTKKLIKWAIAACAAYDFSNGFLAGFERGWNR